MSCSDSGAPFVHHIKVEEADYDDNVEVMEVVPPIHHQILDETEPHVLLIRNEQDVATTQPSISAEGKDSTVAPDMQNQEPNSPELPGDEETNDGVGNTDQQNIDESTADNQMLGGESLQPADVSEEEITTQDEEDPAKSSNTEESENDQQQGSKCNEVLIDPVAPKRTYTLETKLLRETKVYVHSILLAAKSNFFKCLFSTSGMRETNQHEVKIEVGRNETNTMLIMLRCFYNQNCINDQPLDTVVSVCYMAMKYCFDGLIDKCLDVFASRAGYVTEIEDFNRINVMVNKIKVDLQQHKVKCTHVLTKCYDFIITTFKKLDECFESVPCKLFQIRLETMNLFISPIVQRSLCTEHGNLFLYAMQRWVRNHVTRFNLQVETEGNVQMRRDTLAFVEKLLKSVKLTNVTSDFLTNVMSYDISPFNIWEGYGEWYTRVLQNHIYNFHTNRNAQSVKVYPVLSRQRELKYTRQEKNADIFSMAPVILNGFEIGIYLRIREDRKVHMLCKCKNLLVNKLGFDRAILTFTIKGVLKLNTNSTLWKEPFPRQFTNHPPASVFTDRFTFTYKQNTMCLQMYSLCKLSPAVYNIAKRNGFLITFDIQMHSWLV